MTESPPDDRCNLAWCQRHDFVGDESWHVWVKPIGRDFGAVTLYARPAQTEICPDLPEALDAATARAAAVALMTAAQLAEDWLSQSDSPL